MRPLWKDNWEETKAHFIEWWNRRGLVIGMWGGIERSVPLGTVPDPGPPASLEGRYTDPVWRARASRYAMSRRAFPADIIPSTDTLIGPGSLGIILGSQPELAEDTVWYHPCIVDPESYPPIRFNPEGHWWKVHEAILREEVRMSHGNYLVGCPDLIENFDTLAALRDTQPLLVDLLERPEWVKDKIAEINRAYFQVFDRTYDIIKTDDNGFVFGAFRLWGPGKTAKVQCDGSAMISPAAFEEFVLPALNEQCRWLDFSMYHLDGTQCLCHLDHILSIDALDAVEWTPQYGIPGGGDPLWRPVYRRILEAGKSVQAVGVHPDQIVPLLNAVGSKGMYIITWFDNEAQALDLVRKVAPFRA